MICPKCNADWPDNMAVNVDASVYFTFTFNVEPLGYTKQSDVTTYDERTISCTECHYDTSGSSPEQASEEAWEWANRIGNVPGKHLRWAD